MPDTGMCDSLQQANGQSLRLCTHTQARGILTCSTPTVALLIVRGKVAPDTLLRGDQIAASELRVMVCQGQAECQ